MRSKEVEGILKLKKSLIDNEISLDEAIEEFTNLLIPFQDDHEVDEERLILKRVATKIDLKLLDEIDELDIKITHLNKVIILQELGIKFEDDEMLSILGR